MKHLLALLLLSAVVVAQQTAAPATLVLRNGKIVTVDAAMPEAQAIAIRGDRIVARRHQRRDPAVRRPRHPGDRPRAASWRCPASSRATATSWASASRA